MNFLAFLLPLGLYLYWFILGKATLTLLYTQRHTTRSNFLAPIVGFAVLQLAIFLPNWFGLPVKFYALLITILLFVLSLVILYRKKPILFCKQECKFYLLMLAGYTFFAFPLLKFGFHWYSFGNDDMVNYCLAALRYINNGYNVPFNLTAAMSQKDYTQFSWFLMNAGHSRCGSMLYLAWLAVCAHLSPVAVFMPLTCAQNLLIFSGIIAISYNKKKQLFSLLALLLIISSPLNTLGVLYQLIAQVGGIALILGCAPLVFHNFKLHYVHVTLKLSFLIAILLATLAIYYPELSPFLIFSLLIYYLVGILRKNIAIKPLLTCALLSLFFALLIINTYSVNVFQFMLFQVHTGINAISLSSDILFPYFLKSNGAALLFGLEPIGAYVSPSHNSVYTIVAFLLFAASFIYTIGMIRRNGKAYHYLYLIIAFIALLLFFQKNGFGTFKIAMYMQPFLLLVIAEMFTKKWLKHNWYKSVLVLFLFCLIGIEIDSAYFYICHSFGSPGAFVEIPYASYNDLEATTKEIMLKNPSKRKLLINTQPNIVISKLLSLFFYGNPYNNVSRNFSFEKGFYPEMGKLTAQLNHSLKSIYTPSSFVINEKMNHFQALNYVQPFVYLTSSADILNSSYLRATPGTINNFVVKEERDLKNYLVFIDSTLGHDYYFNVNDKKSETFIGRYALEPDFFFHTNLWQVFNTYTLYQIINPAPKSYLVLSLSRTLLPEKNLNPSKVVGAQDSLLSIVGYGSARIASSQITPRLINGRNYIMLDLGPAAQFQTKNSDLNGLYNQDIQLDPRQISAYIRSVRLYTKDELNALKTPSAVSQFPKDLGNPNLFYSGVYEDGWIGNSSYFILNKNATQRNLTISIAIPQEVGPTNLLTVWVDDKPIATQAFAPGDARWVLPIAQLSTGKHKVQLQFSKMISLPAPDNRPVSGTIHFIGFTPE